MVGIYWYKNLWRASINAQYIAITEIGFELHHPLFDAFILKQGAQLIHFQPRGSEPLLWSASLATFEKGKAFRGGIPLCWPWFGKAGTPSHGFARIVEWEMVHYTESKESISLIFALRDTPATHLIWPYAFTTRLEMNLGRDITLVLRVNAEQESTAALHTYFACKNIDDVVIIGLGNTTYSDALQEGLSCRSEDAVLQIIHSIDRIYTEPKCLTVFKENERIINITHENHSDVVVWNPWKEGAEKLADMQQSDYKKMLCIETARISKPLSTQDYMKVVILKK